MKLTNERVIGTLETVLGRVVGAFVIWLGFALMPVFRHMIVILVVGRDWVSACPVCLSRQIGGDWYPTLDVHCLSG
ncbi:MAG: hypothetical protein JWO89_2314 [Verrucomicrobiaceae bacterium]|nr:hypothetical protein [Verrucomicrobiaceae bacterium]